MVHRKQKEEGRQKGRGREQGDAEKKWTEREETREGGKDEETASSDVVVFECGFLVSVGAVGSVLAALHF